MKVIKPDIYDEFHCTANLCKHTCCSSWEIDIDENTYAYYLGVEGEFGERLRNGIKKEKQPYFKMLHGYCPFLSEDHLCQIYQELGEKAMCNICTEYPRVYFDYGNKRQYTIMLSCEEVGRLLFTHKEPMHIVEQEIDSHLELSEEDSYDPYVIEWVEQGRNKLIGILQDRTRPIRERIQIVLQEAIEIEQVNNLDKKEERTPALGVMDYSKESHQLFRERMDIILDMCVVEEEWEEEINNVERAFCSEHQEELYLSICHQFEEDMKKREYEYEQMMVYFIYRYVIKAVKDKAFLKRVKLCILFFLILRDMDRMRYLIHGNKYTLEDRVDILRIFSKEIEHTGGNKTYLMDMLELKSAFANDKMMKAI